MRGAMALGLLEQHPVGWNRFQRSNDRIKLLYRL